MKKLILLFLSVIAFTQTYGQSVLLTPGSNALDVKVGNSNILGTLNHTAPTGYILWQKGNTYYGYAGMFANTSNNSFDIGTNGTNSTGSLNLVTRATPRMTILTGGKIGIGTVTPTAKLQIDHDGSDTDPHIKINSSGTDGESRINWTTVENNNRWVAQSNLDGATDADNYWRLEYSGTSLNPYIFNVKGNGDIGINKSTPSQRLNMSDGNFLMETGSTDKILMSHSGTGAGGEVDMYTSSGQLSLELKASDGANTAGEINLFIPSTGVRTVEIDGNWSNSGKSRIVVDELQIKGGSDLAEFFKINTLSKLEAGTVVSVSDDNTGNLEIAKKAYDKKVVGIISGANGVSTGLMLHQKGNEIVDGDYPIAINGRVYVKAEAFKNAIKPGDLLTSSDIEGYAMKVDNAKKSKGAIIGKALTGLAKDKGMVLVLIGLN